MKVTFITNYLSHHQIFFCNAMYELLKGEFYLISTKMMDTERIQMGWGINNTYPPYEIEAYKSKETFQKAKQLTDESDVVIIGSAPDSYIVNRLKRGQLTFKYSERLYKQRLTISKLPRAIISAYLHHGRFQKYPIYMLCASAYMASDCSKFGNYINRTYQWGYFPEVKEYDIEMLMEGKRSEKISILWAGRFIDLKHPEHALLVASKLASAGINFELKMIGNGKEFERIKNMAIDMGLDSVVKFLGGVSPEEVRKYMEKANIFLFTSDFNEGWGAVLNESMNSGCAVIASHAIGAVPFLIKQGVNGLIYRNGDVEDLCRQALALALDINACKEMGQNAYLTMYTTWNAKLAAARFILLSENLLQGKVCEFQEGPCSRAPLIKDNWF